MTLAQKKFDYPTACLKHAAEEAKARRKSTVTSSFRVCPSRNTFWTLTFRTTQFLHSTQATCRPWLAVPLAPLLAQYCGEVDKRMRRGVEVKILSFLLGYLLRWGWWAPTVDGHSLASDKRRTGRSGTDELLELHERSLKWRQIKRNRRCWVQKCHDMKIYKHGDSAKLWAHTWRSSVHSVVRALDLLTLKIRSVEIKLYLVHAS